MQLDPDVVDRLSQAESLDDLDDQMAATLFGDEDFDAIAAEVVADGPSASAAPDEPVAEAPAVQPDREDSMTATDTAIEQQLAANATGNRVMGHTGLFDMSLAKRFKILENLKNDDKEKGPKKAP